MKTVTIHDAKTNLSKYIARAKAGEKIYIGGFGNAEVVLTKISDKVVGKKSVRDFSALKGLAVETPDSFSDETEKMIADLMLGN